MLTVEFVRAEVARIEQLAGDRPRQREAIFSLWRSVLAQIASGRAGDLPAVMALASEAHAAVVSLW